MHPIELTPRLHTVAALVPQGVRLADIGTDHGYLPAWLLQQGRISSAVAADLRSGPLERAKQTAQKYQLTHQFTFCLCDGLVGIQPEQVDAVVIAGMGGETIAAILSAAPWLLEGKHTLVLQPMSAHDTLRHWLWSNGYTIPCERLSQEDEKIYVVMQAVPGVDTPPTAAELWGGKQWPTQREPLRSAYLAGLIKRVERAVAGLRQSTKAGDDAKRETMEAVEIGLKAMKEEWDSWQQ